MKLKIELTPLQILGIGAYLATFSTLMMMAAFYHLTKPKGILLSEEFQGWVTFFIGCIGIAGMVWICRKSLRRFS